MSYKPSKEDWSQYDKYIPSNEDLGHYENDQDNGTTTAFGAFGRSALKAPAQLTHTLMTALGLPAVSVEEAAPTWFKEGDIQHPIAQTLGSVAVPYGIAGKAIGLGAKGINAYRKLQDLKNQRSYKEQLGQATQESAENENAFNDFMERLKTAYGTKDEASLLRKANQASEKANEVQDLANEPLENISNRLPGATGEGLIPAAEAQTEQAANEIENVGSEIRPELRHNETHDVNLQRIINPILRANRQEISRGFNNLGEELSSQNVTIPNTNTAQELTSQLTDLIKNGGIHSEEATNLLKELDKVGKDEVIPADVYLRSYRTAEQLSREAMNRARQVGKLTDDQRKQFEDLAERYENQANQMSQYLEENVGEDVLPRLEELKSRWANEVRALDRNPFHRKLASNNPINTPNMMQALRGDARGQAFLRQIIMNNPEALRNLIGRTYANNPEGLLTAPPEEMQYIERLPSLMRLRQRLQQAQHQHGEALTREQQVREHVRNLEAENKRIAKGFEEDVAREKGKAEAKKLHTQLKEKQKNLERDIKINRQLREKKENSLKKSIELDEKVKQMNADLERIKNASKEIAKLIVKGIVGVETINIVRKILK
jgi:hypothetical protein